MLGLSFFVRIISPRTLSKSLRESVKFVFCSLAFFNLFLEVFMTNFLPKQNPYFDFYYSERFSDDEAQTFLNFANEKFLFICDFFELSSDDFINVEKKLSVIIYDSIDDFQKDLCGKVINSWFKGTTNSQRVIMAFDSKRSNFYTLFHELVHLVHFSRWKNCNARKSWASEGIATYLANPYSKEAMRKKINFLKSESVYKMFSKSQNIALQNECYTFSSTIIEYIIETYSKKTLLEMLFDLNNAFKILGITKKEFINDWKFWLIKKLEN